MTSDPPGVSTQTSQNLPIDETIYDVTIIGGGPVGLFGAFTVAFALSRWFALSLLLLGASGAADMVSVVIRGTLIQVRVPSAMQGRLTAINQIFIGSSNEIGAFESGVAARLLGTVPSVVVGGTITLLVVATAAWRAPALRQLEKI